MTTTTLTHRPPASSYGIGDGVRSEWTKFMSLRSTRWTLALFPVTAIAFGMVIGAATGAHWPHMTAQARTHWDPTNNLLAALVPGYLLVPVLGVLMMTSEYGSGSIRSTLAALPRRPLVLASKAIVFALVAFVACEAVTLATFAAGQAVMGSAPHAHLNQPGVLRALVLSPGFLVLMGLFGLGIGAIVRRSAAAVAVYAGFAVVVPPILSALPGRLWKFGPIIIMGNSVGAVKIMPGFLSPWAGFGVMAAYAALALGAGAFLLAARDA
ncbi:MAG TPA: ABC transporter permease [Actinomycetota bacterium]|nr:ABC transporter permease [Actinomycetota bacterium]